MAAQTQMMNLTASNLKELKETLSAFNVLSKKVKIGDGTSHMECLRRILRGMLKNKDLEKENIMLQTLFVAHMKTPGPH